jgi:MoxR-like ATPase
LVSAASNQNGQNAISEVRTYVEKLKNGDYVAEADVAAKVGNTISTMLLQTANDNALAALAAKADANSDNISALLLGMTGSGATADIQTRIANALSGFISTADLTSAKSEIYSAISAKDSSDNFISLSALKTSVDTNTATLSALT